MPDDENTTVYAIEPGERPGEYYVVEYSGLGGTTVYIGTQAECEKYQKDHEKEG